MWWLPLQHWLAVHTGSLNTPGTPPNYNFFSGSGSDLGEFLDFASMSAVAIVFIRHHNCEVRRCWRLGRHRTAANHAVCRRHHPDDHLTATQVHNAHHAALAGQPEQEKP